MERIYILRRHTHGKDIYMKKTQREYTYRKVHTQNNEHIKKHTLKDIYIRKRYTLQGYIYGGDIYIEKI